MSFKILIAPGLGSSGPVHWQTIWEKENPTFTRIEQDDWDRPKSKDWINRIEEMVDKNGPNVVIVAHSLACIALVHWANQTKKSIKGALLVAPADSEKPGFPEEAEGFAPIPLNPLPFRSVVIASINDPYMTIERSTYLSDRWKSRFINVGSKGHINSDSNLGTWEEGKCYLAELLESIGP